MSAISQPNPMSVSPQKRKAESASLATQASPATPVPSLPDSAEASQGSAYPAGRHGNAFNNKGRDDHDPLSLLTTVRGGDLLYPSVHSLHSARRADGEPCPGPLLLLTPVRVPRGVVMALGPDAVVLSSERHGAPPHPLAARQEEEGQLRRRR